ncbi:hypothetical protein J7E79_12000 [Bacillus sp. ISL-40]|uniref:hypothetical protein n=1 Tax=unclassified Bacillus (in: firmicutes) TaxID=185979 RepID=UPI001BEC0D06|nr:MULTISPECIES: hypothetical protein [unclassified Bacillus (in: firmicutes)]MBT2698136.1 hypothetical protein [Bacillus sp. ISL-40]MBT2742042.1 hypothetical protein [Bacillus sp. ISL-77]
MKSGFRNQAFFVVNLLLNYSLGGINQEIGGIHGLLAENPLKFGGNLSRFGQFLQNFIDGKVP